MAPTQRPAEDVAAYLNGKHGLVLGTSLFVGPVRSAGTTAGGTKPVPGLAVFVIASGGPPPQPVMGQDRSNYRARVQVRVRSARLSFQAGETLARAVLHELHCARPAGYVLIKASTSEPLAEAGDASDLHEWTVPVEAWFNG
jgi:hypothetical protein